MKSPHRSVVTPAGPARSVCHLSRRTTCRKVAGFRRLAISRRISSAENESGPAARTVLRSMARSSRVGTSCNFMAAPSHVRPYSCCKRPFAGRRRTREHADGRRDSAKKFNLPDDCRTLRRTRPRPPRWFSRCRSDTSTSARSAHDHPPHASHCDSSVGIGPTASAALQR